MEKCIISTCNTIQSKGKTETLLVPLKDNWSELIPSETLNQKNPKICILHFEDKFKDPETGDLLENAFPTIFPMKRKQIPWSADFRCRFCLNKFTGEKIEISIEIANHFHQLTGIELNKSFIYSREICKSCNENLEFSTKLRKKFISKQKFLISKLKPLEEDNKPKPVAIKNEIALEIEIYESNENNEEYIVEELETEEEFIEDQPAESMTINTIATEIKFEDDSIIEEDDNYNYETYYDETDNIIQEEELKIPHRSIKKLKRTSENNKNFLCTDCGQTIRKTSKPYHMLRFHNKTVKRDFMCDICGFTALIKNNLRSHMFKHSSERRHICNHCQKGFKTGKDLNWHIKKMHSEVKNPKRFSCTHCGLVMSTKVGLEDHIYTQHLKAERFECDVSGCGEKFQRHELFKQHKAKHAGISFPCPHCGRVFYAIGQFNLHMKSHLKPEKCNLCEKSFPTPTALRTHINCAHEKKRSYVCTYCGKSYHVQGHLNRHLMEAHMKIKLECEIPSCNQHFARKETYRNHVKNHHKDLGPDEIQAILLKIKKMKFEFDERQIVN